MKKSEIKSIIAEIEETIGTIRNGYDNDEYEPQCDVGKLLGYRDVLKLTSEKLWTAELIISISNFCDHCIGHYSRMVFPILHSQLTIKIRDAYARLDD